MNMGALLSEPVTSKKSFQAVTEEYVIAASSMQGWRESMEDAHTIIVGMPAEPLNAFFGVFDGHGGNKVADFVSSAIFEYVKTEVLDRKDDVRTALQKAFLKLDWAMYNNPIFKKDASGATAIVVIIYNGLLYVANVGDSRAVGYVDGRARPLSTDHKPTLPAERARIVAAGGQVTFERVNGILALSRAFGDFDYKLNKMKSLEEQIVTAFPDILELSLAHVWEFVVLACDGVWDSMTNEAVTDFIKYRIERKRDPKSICEELIMTCMCKRDCGNEAIGTDNMSVILVIFKNHLRRKSYVNNPALHKDFIQSVYYVCNQSNK